MKRAIQGSFDLVQKAIKNIPDDYLVIIMADHGGHDRTHGVDCPEDMTIPVIFYNQHFAGQEMPGCNIMDIAPTVAKVFLRYNLFDILNSDCV